MNRLALGIPLQDENTRTSCKIWIVLDDYRCRNAGDHVAGEYIIGGKLVIAVRRNLNVPANGESLGPKEGFAHSAACA